MRRILVALLLTLAGVGCVVPPALPPGAQISCVSQEDCPSDTECRATLGRCVPVGSEEAPPALSHALAADPPLARAGVTVAITFGVDKPLGRAPRLSVVLPDAASVDVPVEETEPRRYRGALVIEDNMAEGLASALLELLGADGNPARIERPGLFRVDTTPPAVVLARAEQALYGAGETAVLRVELDEPVDLEHTSARVTRIDDEGGAHEVTDLFLPLQLAGQGTSLLFLGARTLTEGDDGRYLVELSATDLAGNTSEAAAGACDGTCFEVDAIAPAATLDAVYRAGAQNEPDRDRIGVLAGFNELVIETALDPDHPDEALELLVTVGGVRASEGCVASGAATWTCRHLADPNAPSGHHPVVVTVIDEAGNRGSAEAAVVVDAAGPQPLGRAQLQRDDGNVRAHVEVDRVLLNRSRVSGDEGAPAVLVSAYLNERLGLEPPVVVLRRDGHADRPLELDEGWASEGALLSARYLQSGDEPEGDYDVVVTAWDRLGNEGSATLGTVTVDETPPSIDPAFLAAHVVHERRPWGEAGAPTARFGLRFDDGIEPEATARVFNSGTLASAQLLGEAHADAFGVVGTIPLPNLDVPEVFLLLRDRAGNALSTPSRVHRQRWVASLGSTPTSSSPHEAVTTTRMSERSAVAPRPYRRSLADDQGLLASGSLDVADAVVVTSTAPDDWVAQARWPSGDPTAGWLDDATGTTRWLFGTTVWEDHRDPRVVSEVDVLLDGRPRERDLAAVAGPRRGDGVYLYGGQLTIRAASPCPTGSGPNGTCALNDLWRFTGGEWRQLEGLSSWSPGLAPAPRLYPALGYDEGREVLVLFGGYAAGGTAAEDCRHDVGGPLPADDENGAYVCNDLWEHDGVNWTRIAPAGAWPEGRSGASFVWDPTRGALFLFGGSWYDSDGWACPAEANQQAWGGCEASDLWRYEAGSLTKVFAGLGDVTAYEMYYSTGRGALVTDSYDGVSQRLYEREGDALVVVEGAQPPCGAVLAPADGARDAVAPGAGCLDFTLWDGMASTTASSAAEVSVASPVASTLAFGRPYSVGQELLWSSSTLRMLLWDGDDFDDAPFSFLHRSAPHIVFDEGAREWLFFGGRDLGGSFIQFLSTHAFDDRFTPETRTGDYVSTSQSAAWYEPSFERVVVIGLQHASVSDYAGTHAVRVLERAPPGGPDAWLDCGDASVPSAFCTAPPASRVELAVAHDPAAGWTVAYGGRSQDAGCQSAVELFGSEFSHACADTWLWDGEIWSEVVPIDDEGDGEPSALLRGTAAYDPARGVVLVGVDPFGQRQAWSFDGDSWRRLHAVDGERDGEPSFGSPTLSYDHVRGALLLSDASGRGVWALESNHDARRPAVLGTFALSAASVPSLATTLVGLTVRATGGATGAHGDGVEVALFDEQRGLWEPLAAREQGASGLTPFEASATGEMGRFLPSVLGPSDVVRARVTPAHGAGSAPDGGRLVITRLELVADFDLNLEATD